MKYIEGDIIVFTCDGAGCIETLRTHVNTNSKKYLRAMGWLRCLKSSRQPTEHRRHYCSKCRAAQEARQLPAVPGVICAHTDTKEGPRAPARYGAWATDLCQVCGMYRTKGHVLGRWLPGPVPNDKDQDDE